MCKIDLMRKRNLKTSRLRSIVNSRREGYRSRVQRLIDEGEYERSILEVRK
jgi:hypothetical protein